MTGKQRFLYRLQYGAIKLFACLPFWVLYGLSDFVAFILERIVKYRANVIEYNLKKSFPEASAEQLKQLRSGFYHNLCDVFIEAAKLAHISNKSIDRHVKISGVEGINDSLREGKSVILFLGHYGNWEWVTSAARFFLPGVISCEIYHPLTDVVFDNVMLKLRSRFETENIPMKKAVRRLLEIHNSGKQFVCGFISDQRPFWGNVTHWTTFLNHDTDFVAGGEVIGNKVGADYFYAEMLRVKRGYYELTFTKLKPEDTTQDLPFTRQFYKELEKSIHKAPSAWLWSHNRWIRSKPK